VSVLAVDPLGRGGDRRRVGDVQCNGFSGSVDGLRGLLASLLPGRRELLEAVYIDEIDAVCDAALTVRADAPGRGDSMAEIARRAGVGRVAPPRDAPDGRLTSCRCR
jgi:hypothetical protein